MTQMADPTLVVYGAGNIGRGIVSLLFGAAGYRLLFYRRDREALVEMQAKGGYVIHRLGGGEDVPVSDFQVLTSQEELLQALTGCNMTACCLYPSAFPQVGAVLAEACRIRTDPLNVLLCCNEPGGAELLSRAVTQALLPEEGDGTFKSCISFRLSSARWAFRRPMAHTTLRCPATDIWKRNAALSLAPFHRYRAWSW